MNRPASFFEFTFLRHGESVGNAEDRLQGHADYPLTEAGRAQARLLAERWLGEQVTFDLVLTSPLARAKETAQVITEVLHVPLETDPIWMERNLGAMSGLTMEEIHTLYPQPEFRSPYEPFGEDGEGDWELFLRAGIVTHGGLLNKLMYAILGIPVQANSNGPRFRFSNGGFVTFHYKPARHQWLMLRFESTD